MSAADRDRPLMPPPTPQQQLRRARIEGLIGLAAPLLDFVLAAGERVSKIVGPGDEYIPIRAPSEAFELPHARPPGGEPASKPELTD